MKSISEYTIYCTKEQTRKAIELGASIERGHESSRYFNIGVPTYYDENDEVCRVKNSIIFIPTAEQMINWLEGQDGIEEITVCKTGMWIWGKNHTLIKGSPSYSSRQESTHAAIDAALEYLMNNKK